MRLLLISLFCLNCVAWGQDTKNLPQNYQEFQQAFLNLKLPGDQTQAQINRELQWRKQFAVYLQGIRAEAFPGGTTAADNDLFRQFQIRQEMAKCLESVTRTLQGQFFNSVGATFDECERRYDASKLANWMSLKSKGIDTPNQFIEKMRQENNQYLVQSTQLQRADEVTVTELMRFDEAQPLLDSRPVLGEQPLRLAQDATSILLALHRTQNLSDFVAANPTGEGVAELAELAWLAGIAEDENHPCRASLQFRSVAENDPMMRSILLSPQGADKDGELHSPLQLFLGQTEERGMKKVSAFQWVEQGRIRYLFHTGKFGETTDRWVLAELDPTTGVMALRHFEIVKQLDVLPSEKAGYKLVNGRFVLQGMNNELDAQFGINVQTRVARLPWNKNTVLPTGTVQLGQVSFLRHGAKANTLYNMSLSVDQVQASAGIMPMNGIWSAQVGGTYDIFNNSFRVTSDVRVWNLTVGASTNLKDKNQVQVGYVFGRSYVNYLTDFKEQQRFTAGTMLGKKKSGAAAWSWQPKTGQQEVTLVIFLR